MKLCVFVLSTLSLTSLLTVSFNQLTTEFCHKAISLTNSFGLVGILTKVSDVHADGLENESLASSLTHPHG